jgi:hypothetical protein
VRIDFGAMTETEQVFYRERVKIEHGVQAKCRRCRKIREVVKKI